MVAISAGMWTDFLYSRELAWMQLMSRKLHWIFLAKNIVLLLLLKSKSSQTGLSSLPGSWMTPHEQYRDILSSVLLNILIYSHHRPPLYWQRVAFSFPETPEWLFGLENVPTAFFGIVVSRKLMKSVSLSSAICHQKLSLMLQCDLCYFECMYLLSCSLTGFVSSSSIPAVENQILMWKWQNH